MINPLQEDRGLLQVHATCVEMHAIWRPTPCHDLGVDGQIEFLEYEQSVISTGKIVGVQVKSGPSYFLNRTDEGVKYYPTAKHRAYWAQVNIPMILVLHNPETFTTIYIDIKNQLELPEPILVPHKNNFDRLARYAILELCDRQDDPARVLAKLARICLSVQPNSIITGIEFLLCCLPQNHDYFELRMSRFDTLVEIVNKADWICYGREFYEYIERCSLVCIGAKIADPFAESFEEQWFDHRLVPEIRVPLTPFGRRVVDYLIANANKYVSLQSFSHTGIGDSLAIVNWIKYKCTKIADLLDAEPVLIEYISDVK
jgi:hypothetical protein